MLDRAPSISMDMHKPADAVIGFLLIAFPFVLDMGAAAMVISVLLGSTLVALAYGGWREADSISPSTHMGVDRLVAAGVGVGALLALGSGHVLAGVLLALAGLLVAGLTLTTRYRAGPRQRATTVTWDNRRTDARS